MGHHLVSLEFIGSFLFCFKDMTQVSHEAVARFALMRCAQPMYLAWAPAPGRALQAHLKEVHSASPSVELKRRSEKVLPVPVLDLSDEIR